MRSTNISFIGGGNMARSLIGGLLADGVDPARLWAADPGDAAREALATQFGITTTQDNAAAAARADCVVLAVKPQVLRAVCLSLVPAIEAHRPLVISVAAGVRETDLRRWLGADTAIVRTMPNTPALVQCGATGLFANRRVSAVQRELAEALMRAVGMAVWVDDEAQLDTVTALSGSGPAYFFLVMEALEKAAVEAGLPAASARLLTLQTAFGAARMALESSEGPATLRARVTSPGGTTERAIGALLDAGTDRAFAAALDAAAQRSRELGDLLGRDA